jgi:hypothetical protein
MIRRTAFAGLILAWFFFFNWDAVGTPFGADDMMNIAAHWRPNPWQLLYSPFLLWRDFHRPLGGLFYVPIFSKFGLNPWPFHAALLVVLLVNAALLYRLARVLGGTELVAWLAALIAAYHAGLVNLYWDTAHVYDALCAVFFSAALICYVGGRIDGRPLTFGRTAAFLALFLCGLNSKEMAVTLPAVLFAYELFYHREHRSWRVPVIAAVLSAVFLWGRVLHGLIGQAAYAPSASWGRLLEFQQHAWRNLLLLDRDPGWITVLSIWAGLTYLAFRRDRPVLRLCWAILVLTPLPIEFLEGRGEAVLAVPLIGAAIFAAVLFTDFAWTIADAFKGEPLFVGLSRDGRVACIVAAGLLLFAVRNQAVKNAVPEWKFNNGRASNAMIAQFRALNPRVRPHSTVVFLNDPFDQWDMALIAELWFHDRSLNIRLQKKTPLSEAELRKADYLFDYRDGKLLPVRSP